MMLVSITGLTLIFFLHKRLALGLWMLAIGTAVSVAVYAWFVYRSHRGAATAAFTP